jgi:hypothetical protein
LRKRQQLGNRVPAELVAVDVEHGSLDLAARQRVDEGGLVDLVTARALLLGDECVVAAQDAHTRVDVAHPGQVASGHRRHHQR